MGLTPDTSDMYPGSQMSHASYNGGHQRHAHPDILDAHGAWWVSCTLELICMFDVHTGNAVSETATFQRSRPLARGGSIAKTAHMHILSIHIATTTLWADITYSAFSECNKPEKTSRYRHQTTKQRSRLTSLSYLGRWPASIRSYALSDQCVSRSPTLAP